MKQESLVKIKRLRLYMEELQASLDGLEAGVFDDFSDPLCTCEDMSKTAQELMDLEDES